MDERGLNMKPEIMEIIKSIIVHGSNIDIDQKHIALSILNLKYKWPNLTIEEQKEIENVAYLLETEENVSSILDDIEFQIYLTEEEYFPVENIEGKHRIKKFINIFRFKRNN